MLDFVERTGLIGQVNGCRLPQRQCNLMVGRWTAFDCEWQRNRRVVPAAEADQHPGSARHLNIDCARWKSRSLSRLILRPNELSATGKAISVT